MSAVLLLRLAGPMQSWGTRSRFSNRDTGLEPSRSGVVGLLCAALGVPRDDDAGLEEFALDRLQMAVRVDREGRLMRDYHTVENCRKADGTMPARNKRFVVSERFYLADADFLVGLEGDGEFLNRLARALAAPRWQLCLGRKAFVPSLPVCEGVRPGPLAGVVAAYPWRKRSPWDRPDRDTLRHVVEVPFGTGEPRPDVPLSFVSRDRRFAVRHVRTEFHPVPRPLLELDQEPPRVPQPTHPEPA